MSDISDIEISPPPSPKGGNPKAEKTPEGDDAAAEQKESPREPTYHRGDGDGEEDEGEMGMEGFANPDDEDESDDEDVDLNLCLRVFRLENAKKELYADLVGKQLAYHDGYLYVGSKFHTVGKVAVVDYKTGILLPDIKMSPDCTRPVARFRVQEGTPWVWLCDTEGAIRKIDMEHGNSLARLPVPKGKLRAPFVYNANKASVSGHIFHLSDKYIFTNVDKNIQCFDLNLKFKFCLMSHTKRISALSHLYDDTGSFVLVSGAGDKRIMTWRIPDDQPDNKHIEKYNHKCKGHRSTVKRLETHGTFIFSGSRDSVRVWTKRGRLIKRARFPKRIDLTCLAVKEGRLIFAGLSNGDIRVFRNVAGDTEIDMACLCVLRCGTGANDPKVFKEQPRKKEEEEEEEEDPDEEQEKEEKVGRYKGEVKAMCFVTPNNMVITQPHRRCLMEWNVESLDSLKGGGGLPIFHSFPLEPPQKLWKPSCSVM